MGFMKSKGILPNGGWRAPVVAPVVQVCCSSSEAWQLRCCCQVLVLIAYDDFDVQMAQTTAGTLQRTRSGQMISAERQSRLAAVRATCDFLYRLHLIR